MWLPDFAFFFWLDIYGESVEFASNGLLWLSGVFLLSEQMMGSVDQRKSCLCCFIVCSLSFLFWAVNFCFIVCMNELILAVFDFFIRCFFKFHRGFKKVSLFVNGKAAYISSSSITLQKTVVRLLWPLWGPPGVGWGVSSLCKSILVLK